MEHIKLGKGDFFSFPEEWWPTRSAIRLDISLIKIRQDGDDCYWKDIYITPVHPTALFGFAPLDRLKPFYSCSGIWAAAKNSSAIREQLIKMLRNTDTEKAIRENIMDRNRQWIVSTWVVRTKPNALEFFIDKNNQIQSKEIELYKEPMFTPTSNPNFPPCFSDGTTPVKNEQELNKLPYLEIYAGTEKIYKYQRSELLKMKGDCLEVIKSVWETKVRQIMGITQKTLAQVKSKTKSATSSESSSSEEDTESSSQEDSDIQILDKEVEEAKYRMKQDIKRKEQLKGAEKEHSELLETFKNKTVSYEKKLEELINQNDSTKEIKPTEERSEKQEKEVNLDNTKGLAAEEKKVAPAQIQESKDKDKANSKSKEKE